MQPGFTVANGGTLQASATACFDQVGQWRFEYLIADHLGNNRVLFADVDGNGSVNPATEIIQENHYYPFGLEMEGIWSRQQPETKQRYRYNGKELNQDLGLYDYGDRNYDPAIGRWLQIDPLADKMPGWSPYNYTMGNPINLVDPDGREPIKPFVGTAAQFKALLDNSPSKVGQYAGQAANRYVGSLDNTEFSWKQMRPLPTQTGYFNQKEGRYIYTKKGGWVDMAHFMFYAGKAHQYKADGHENPVGEAVQDGYAQEASDSWVAGHSAYSYEDLPSDKFGADFATNYFDPDSDATLGEQILSYLNEVLGATDPENAPNYDQLPETDGERNVPSRQNRTTTPVYTEDNR
ncbi:hypothetical protein NMA52_06005 [Lewinella sp. JB7]|nr:RHS repeat-associated core domain-containing protein [Lewinella sp. JB7]MCP9235493.1 hypothetical protein [Lewinella sp. JB7]